MAISVQLTTQHPTLEMCQGRAQVFLSSTVKGTELNVLEPKISSPPGKLSAHTLRGMIYLHFSKAGEAQCMYFLAWEATEI